MLARLNDRWGLLNPWKGVEGLHEELADLFRGFDEGLNRYRTSYPQLVTEEKDKEISVKVLLPGYSKDDLEVEAVSDFLTIRAERKPEELPEGAKYVHRERDFGKYEETLKMPAKVKSGEVTATFKDGVLEITLPKEDSETPRSIKVK